MFDFISFFPQVFAPNNFAILLLGTVGGLLLGAAPGLSPTMAVALLIPFTFHMPPTTGLILLGAVYAATVAGGAVSAILLKIPGAPANIATTFDGHPMALAGRASEALHYCFISSCIGGLIGMAALVFFTPALAEWALGFGPSHLFWIAVLGVTVIGTLGSASLFHGLMSGGIGLWISTIGYDPVLGEERFIFHDHLTGGINIIAALVGLFAIPQALTMLAKARKARAGEMLQMERRGILRSLAFNLSRFRALSIGGIVGVIIGLIPGAGGQIAGLIAYDQAKKWSRNSAAFGTGDPDGVIAAESANNAMVGPSLVPLLTLSVPGSPTAAVLLGGLLIHGIFPGPDLFVTYADVAWTFIDAMIVGQILLLAVGLYISRLSRHVMAVPPHYMAAAIVVLAVFGTFSVQHNVSDVLIMMTMGVGMFFLSKFGFSAAPAVLGIILGPIAETNYVQGKLIANAQNGAFEYFCTGTLNLALIALCLASVGYSAWCEYRAHRRSGKMK